MQSSEITIAENSRGEIFRTGICLLFIPALPRLAAIFSFAAAPQKPKSVAIDHIILVDVAGGPEQRRTKDWYKLNRASAKLPGFPGIA